jgi:hypothetical protein
MFGNVSLFLAPNNSSSDRGSRLRWAKEGTDDRDKAASIDGNANPRRSTSSLEVIFMRSAFFAVCVLLPLTLLANTPQCVDTKFRRADLLTPEQWQAILAGNARGDPVLQEVIAHERERARDDPPQSGVPVQISWKQARTLILLGTVRTTYQAHDLKVLLAMNSGRRFTEEPKLDAISRVVGTVDPCHAYIRQVTE